MTDPTKLNERGLTDGRTEFRQLAIMLQSRLREAEARLAAAETDVGAYRKLLAFVRELAGGYGARLSALEADGTAIPPRPDG